MPTIQNKRGTDAKVQAATLLAGELAFATDTKKLYISDGAAKTVVNPDTVPSADKLSTARDISATGDVTAAAQQFDGTGNVTLTTSIGDGKVTKAKLAQDVQDSIDKADTAVQSVAATADLGIVVAGTATAPTIGVKVDPDAGNALKVTAAGLKVEQGAAPEYTLVKKGTAEAGMAATYQLQKDGVDVPNSIVNIPLDYLVKSAAVKTSTGAGDPSGLAQGDKYIDFVINAKSGTGTEDHIYLAVKDMVTPYTTGSAATDAVVVAISDTNAITATLTDGKITLAKLEAGVQTSLGKADTALQPGDIKATAAGGTDGTITVKDTEIAVKGLGSAAYKSVGTAEGDVLALGAGGKIDTGLLPSFVSDLTAADKSVEVGGTGVSKTVKVAIATKPGNGLTLDTDGLYVGAGVTYTAGNGVDISAANAISAKIDAANANGLSVGADGIGMAVATDTTLGAVKVDNSTIVATTGTIAVSLLDCGEIV